MERITFLAIVWSVRSLELIPQSTFDIFLRTFTKDGKAEGKTAAWWMLKVKGQRINTCHELLVLSVLKSLVAHESVFKSSARLQILIQHVIKAGQISCSGSTYSLQVLFLEDVFIKMYYHLFHVPDNILKTVKLRSVHLPSHFGHFSNSNNTSYNFYLEIK